MPVQNSILLTRNLLAATVAIAMALFMAAAYTSSVAAIAATVFAAVVASHQALLLRDQKVWGLCAGLGLYGLASGIALDAGIAAWRDQRPMTFVEVSYVACIFAMLVIAGGTWFIMRALQSVPRQPGIDLTHMIRREPAVTVLALQSIALVVVIAMVLAATAASDFFGLGQADAAAALAIGLVAAVIVVILSLATRAIMLTGVRLPPEPAEKRLAGVKPSDARGIMPLAPTLQQGPRKKGKKRRR